MKDTNTKILFTGGHMTPAIAVLNELKSRGYKSFIWVGHKYTMLNDKETSAEYKEILSKNIPFYNILAGKLYRHISYLGFISLLRIPIGFTQSLYILIKEKPSLIISFGGYLAVPVAIGGWILRIPILTHEQTATIGLSNKVISKFANKVLVSFESSLKHFPASKTILTGNPVRKDILTKDKKYIEFDNNLPTILVMGGNQGSHRINMILMEALPLLIDKYNIIHQCGSNTLNNDYDKLLPVTEKYSNYKLVKGIWGDGNIGRAFNQSELFIGRSGANTVYELAVLNKRSILIPLPHAVNNEQYENALVLEKIGLSKIIEDKDLTSRNLEKNVNEEIQKNVDEKLIKNIHTIFISDGEKRISDIVEEILT